MEHHMPICQNMFLNNKYVFRSDNLPCFTLNVHHALESTLCRERNISALMAHYSHNLQYCSKGLMIMYVFSSSVFELKSAKISR